MIEFFKRGHYKIQVKILPREMSPEVKNIIKSINQVSWNIYELLSVYRALTSHDTFRATEESTKDGVQIKDTDFLGFSIPKDLKDLFQKTNKEIGLGYFNMQEFVRDAVRTHLEEVGSRFRGPALE